MKNIITNMICKVLTNMMRIYTSGDKAAAIVQYIKNVTQGYKPKEKLKVLLSLDRQLYFLEGQAAIKYGKGVHPKHRVTNYHQFFIDNVKSGEKILDIGSGKGDLSYDIVSKLKDVNVVGIELNRENIEFAKQNYNHPNLKFIQANVLGSLPEKGFDVVVMSNVLEHLEKRIEFLKKLIEKIKPERLLIRVPQYDRDWRLPVKEELGIESLYPGHFIEYTKETFIEELGKAGLEPVSMEFCWGEIWSVVKPSSREK